MLRRLAGGASVILCRQTIGPGRSGSAPLRRTPIWPLYIRQYRTIPALRLKHRSGSCGTASALAKCSIMSGCGTRIVLRGQKPLALCDRCPCFGSLFPPLAALTFAASSIIYAFGLASAAPRSPYRHLELCGIALSKAFIPARAAGAQCVPLWNYPFWLACCNAAAWRLADWNT